MLFSENAFILYEREGGAIKIVLIGGSPGAGKTHTAKNVVKEMQRTTNKKPAFWSTDSLREIARQTHDPKEYPVLWTTSSDAGQYAPADAGDSTIWGLKEQSKMVFPYMVEVVRRCIQRNEDIVLEGIHLIPGYIKMLEKTIMEYQGEVDVQMASVVISVNDVDQHVFQLQNQNRKSTPKKLENIDKIRKMNEYLMASARKHGSLVIENNRDSDEITHLILSQCALDNRFISKNKEDDDYYTDRAKLTDAVFDEWQQNETTTINQAIDMDDIIALLGTNEQNVVERTIHAISRKAQKRNEGVMFISENFKSGFINSEDIIVSSKAGDNKYTTVCDVGTFEHER